MRDCVGWRSVLGGAGTSARRAHARGEANRFGNEERATRRDAVGGEMVPCAKLFDRDAEAVGDGDERVVAAGGVVLLS